MSHQDQTEAIYWFQDAFSLDRGSPVFLGFLAHQSAPYFTKNGWIEEYE